MHVLHVQQNCDQVNDAMQRQLRSMSVAQCVSGSAHSYDQMSYDGGSTSGRNCGSVQRQEFSDDDNDMQLPLDENSFDAAPKFELPAENYGNSQSTSHSRSEPSKRGARSRAKRRRKSEAPSKAKRDLSVDTTPVTAQSGNSKRSKQKSLRRKRKSGQSAEKNEADMADGSHSDDKPTDSATASNDVVHTCEECGKEFPSANVLTRHKRMHSSRVFHCNICSTDFAEPVAFKRHSVVIHDIHRPFTCSHMGCLYRSDRLSNVEKHMSIHSPTHAFACSLCGRTFAQDAGLRSHMLSCMSSRSFLCDLCGSAFNHLQSMQSHQRVHTGERPYRCADCDSTFADHRNYKRHRRIHDNAFPYACMLCGKRFRHSNSLKSHLGSHGIMTKPVDGTSVTPPHSSQTGPLGILSKPVESTPGTTAQPSHSLAHTAF